MRDKVSRRRLLGATALVGATGLGYFSLSQSASASIELGTLQIDDKDAITDTDELDDVILDVQSTYDYEVPSADSVTISLEVSQDNWTEIDSHELTDPSSEDSGSTDLSGSILSHWEFDRTMFSTGGTTPVNAKLSIRVEDDSDTVAEDSVEDDFDVHITDEGDVTMSAEIGGTGTVTVE